MDKVVVSLGGSLVVPERVDEQFVQRAADLFREISKKTKIFLVVGGGRLARSYISLGRKMGASERELDEIGIKATRLNAQLVLSAVGKGAFPGIPKTTSFAVKKGEKYRIVVMGGTEPGHSTDQVAAELASKVGADRLINATNVSGVYTKDPNKHPSAKLLEKISIDELTRLVGGSYWTEAGKTGVLDPGACGLIQMHKLKTLILNGRDLNSLRGAIEGKNFIGTTVSV
ncbi:MAG TPA: UMP kinase [Thermoplasmata archaeon]|nr:UMP kinase [Thermoplasmata archaeon]